ncbi:phage tail-collar fiber domain-containing protein [Pseudomonas brassicacearum]|uniref:phage tail-collar fiber domain-containing protein n=1 Tax=Pseudomonas brassicacearum TaxID=930166 RepID=UPI00218201D4|nr:phage tail protein [Pseudomonas brassicacearum]
MIDQTSQFFAILTNVGAAKQANADALGVPWKLTEMGVGDANGTDPVPSAAQTSLINEWRRRPLNQLFIDPVNPAVIVAEQVIPADEGGFWIREIGLYDADGDLVAVANCPPSFKPIMSQGSGRTQVVRMNFIVSSTGNITLKIDPSVVLATREFVERRIQEELYKLDNKQSVRVATTANIALTGLQTVDGISLLAGDRVLVKNQTASKDNGIYIVGVAAWQRAPDADSSAEVTSALLLSVEQGTTLADTRWQLITDGTIILGTTALTFQNVTQGFAPLNSPALLGAPTAPTVAGTDSSTRIATTAAVRAIMAQFGLGATAFNFTANINDIALSGIYMVSTGTAGAKPVIPGTSTSIPNGTVFHLERGSSNMATQIWDSLISDGTPLGFWRTKTSAGTWTAWASVVTSDHQATQQEAEAGTNTTKWMSPLRVFQAIGKVVTQATETAFGWAKIATQTQTDTGTDDSTFVTPKKLRAGFIFTVTGSSVCIALPSWLGGYMIQTGGIGVSATDLTTTLPIAFPSKFIQVIVCCGYTPESNSLGYVAATSSGLGSIITKCSSPSLGSRYIAIGK